MSNLILMFALTTQTFSLPPGLLSALCFVESSHKVNAIHKDDGNGNSVGLCQIKPQTAKLLGFKGTEKDLLNPKTNLYYSGKYLAKQLQRYQGDSTKAVAAYNAGTYRLNQQGLIMNRQYVLKVYKAWAEQR